MDETATALRSKIERREALIGVIGLGYVGLPLALAFADNGFRVLGFDTDQAKVEQLQQGSSYIRHVSSESVSGMVRSGHLSASSDFGRLRETDVILVCVPTPLSETREPDMSFVETTARQILAELRTGQLIVLESTTYPGTTRQLLKAELESSGMSCGTDFYLAYSPEREDPGNPAHRLASIPKVVGGIDEASGDLTELLYSQVVSRTVRVSSAEAAEACKLTENVFRAVNIALVNELKGILDAMEIDVWEILDAAETKPFGFMRFNPGPGWGGHCIPIDPFYLSWSAHQVGAQARFIELAGDVNTEMPSRVIGKLRSALDRTATPLRASRILVVGLAYKRDVSDPRESPAFEILWQLQRHGAVARYHDPLIPQPPTMRTWKDLRLEPSKPLTAELLEQQNAVIIVTDHTDIDYDLILEHAALIVDTRGVFRQPHEKVIRA